MKIASIVGARPQFVKLAPLSRELRKRHKEVLIHTGQHYDFKLSELFFRELKIPRPDYNLEVGSAEQGKQTGEMLIRLERILQVEKPDWVIVFGDTNSTLAGALAASKLRIPLAHVEAGMRSYNNSMPEEINRKVTDHLSKLLFCPSKNAIVNLKKEGITRGLHLAGDLMQEALTENVKVAKEKSQILQKLDLMPQSYNLVTIHRAENTDSKKRLSQLTHFLSRSDVKIIFPVHPRTKKYLQEYKLWNKLRRVKTLEVIEPVGYLDMLVLEQNARLVLTDSGGVQREAYYLGTPCLILRDETEWTYMLGSNFRLLKDVDRLENLKFTARKPKPPGLTCKPSQKIASILSRAAVPGQR